MTSFTKKPFLAIALIAFLGLAIFAASSGVAMAAAAPGVGAPTNSPNGPNCSIWGTDLCTGFVSFLLTVVSGIMGFFIAIGAWVITIGMSLTSTVYSSQAVQSGFATTLAVANLAFILALIVIALATILHRETYGYKKTLWRVVVMAILINFGLVITAPIVGFANSMTNYFVASTSNGASGTNAIVTFSNTLMTKTNITALQGTVPTSTTNTGGISIGGGIFQTIFSLIFTIIFEGLIAMTFLLLGILLFVRYVYLVVLLVLLPLAWVAWIFPNFSGQFSAWWKKFIHWTFFPPAAMFFVWLAMSIQTNFSSSVNAPTGPSAALQIAMGQSSAIIGGTSATSVLAQMVNTIVVLGIMIGGLMAASKLAEGAGGWAVAQGKAVSGYVGRRAGQAGKRLATAPLRTKLGKNIATRLQQPLTSKTARIINGVALGIPDWTARKLGQGIEAGGVAGGSKAVDAAADRFKGLTKEQKINRLSGVEKENAPAQRMALLKQILEDKNINKLSTAEMERYFGEKEKNTFAKFGQEKLYKDLREKSGLALRDLDREINKLESQPKPLNKKDAEDLADKEKEKKNLVATYIRENPDAAVETFSSLEKLKKRRDEAAASGRVPASLELDSVAAMQRNIATGVAGGLSTQIINTIMKALAEKNNLDGFKDAVEEMKKSTDPAIMAMVAKMKSDYSTNDPVKKWNTSSVRRGTLDIDLDNIYS